MRLVVLAALFAMACGSSETPATDEAPVDAPAADAHADEAHADEAHADEAPAADAHADAPAGAKLNINTATEDAMKAIPGVTDRMVHEFEEYRPYVSITQFRREIGKYVDEATVAGYEQHIYVPIQYNECDAATLQQIPGVDAAVAESLIGGRPFASKDEFITMLEAVGSNDAAHAATALLAE